MGVIRKNDPKLGIFASSEESLNIPDSSDDEHAGSSTEDAELPQAMHVPRRLRHRVPSVPMSFCNQRKRLGKKRSRRYDNVNQLVTLVEEDELGEVSFHDLVQNSNDAFQRLLEDSDSLEAWNNFIQSSEEVQMIIASEKGFHERSKKKQVPFSSKTPMTGEQAFRNIKTGLRNVLKKNRVPLGMLGFLENQVVEFFSKMPSGIYTSSSLSSYERLLLHAVSQYHSLISYSFDSTKEQIRLVRVSNPYEVYQMPTVLLGQYLEDKRKPSATVH
ncbi:R3H domain-containing protein 4-like isoform X1 [Periplaneta americana]|uniref:R3H domain-containing protein 4-like isoform X1 n=2 Tax=Periplaneta americana TaxID=6978 RepID=UPI0037E99362